MAGVTGGLAGFLLWLASQFLGIVLAGAGHGWTEPFFAAIPLAVLYPLALTNVFGGKMATRHVTTGILAMAIGLDAYLAASLSAKPEYFLKAWAASPDFVATWLLLWTIWNIIAIASAVRSTGAGLYR
jgi:hypothetical protein